VNCYPVIEAEKAQQRNVKRACELLEVSRAAFYARLAGPSRRDRADQVLTAQIRAVHKESKGRYGAPRVHAELRRKGHRHGRKRIARLMRSAGLAGRAARRWKKTTIPDPAAAARADRIRRDFTADASKLNSRWCGDITYLRAKGPHRGQPLSEAGLRRVFRYHREIAGVPAGNPHALRHTFGTALAEAGVDLAVMQALLGHAHVDTSARYAHLAPAHVKAEFDAARDRIRARG
jgi:hypothetical protein